MFCFFIGVMFLALLPLFLGTIIPIVKNHRTVTGDTVNYDCNMRRFVYKVKRSKEEIIDILKTHNVADELLCEFEPDGTIVKISDYDSYRKNHIIIQECDSYCILRLESVELIGVQSYIQYKLTPFMVSKLSAEPVPYEKYGI